MIKSLLELPQLVNDGRQIFDQVLSPEPERLVVELEADIGSHFRRARAICLLDEDDSPQSFDCFQALDIISAHTLMPTRDYYLSKTDNVNCY